MPSGPPICRLRASARRTSGNGCSGSRSPQAGWPTPDASVHGAKDLDRLQERRAALKAKGINGNGFGLTLTQAAPLLAGWPSPTKADGERGSTMYQGEHNPTLLGAAQLAGWPTPTQQDQAMSGARNYPATATHHTGTTLTDAAQLAGWGTPTCEDAKSSSLGFALSEQARDPNVLRNQAYLAGWATPRANRWDEPDSHGKTVFGSRASTGKRGALNPLFSLWLMLGSGALARAWVSCAPQGTRSSRSSRQSSSEHAAK